MSSTSFPMGWFTAPVYMPPRNLEEERDQLRAQLEALKKDVAVLSTKPTANAVILAARDGRLTVRAGGQVINVPQPGAHEFHAGEIVEVAIDGGAVIRRHAGIEGVGTVFTVKRERPSAHSFEIEGPGMPGTRAVFSAIEGVAVGDRVLVDESHTTILTNLGKAPSEMAFAEETGVTWDDVGGQVEAKRALREAIEEPFLHADLYKKFGKRRTKGVLLHGYPGNGKTMLGKAVATAVAALHGDSGRRGGFIYVKGPEMLDKFVGESEAGVRRLFDAARAHKQRHGYPAVVFIDEADAIVGKRGTGHRVEGMERTIVPQFLAEMDGLEESDAFLILATNRPEAIDAAVLRKGRVDRSVVVSSPTKADFADIVARELAKKLVGPGATPVFLGQLAADEAWGDKCTCWRLLSKTKPAFPVPFGEFCSGAVAVGVAEAATQLALRRHLAGDDGDREAGIRDLDVLLAVADTMDEVIATIDPAPYLGPLAHAMGEDFAGAERAT